MRKIFLLILTISLALTILSSCENSSTDDSIDNSTSTPDMSENVTSSDDDLDQLKQEFCLIDCYVSEPNSASGVDCFISFWNLERRIKYATFWVEPYNAVDDIVSCSIRNRSEVKIKYTGPVDTYSPTTIELENAWYNNTIRSAKITKIEIEFMDDTIFTTEKIQDITTNNIQRNEFNLFVVKKTTLKRAINNLCEEKGITQEEFIENTGSAKDQAEKLFDPTERLDWVGITSIVDQFAEAFNMTPAEFIFSL